MAKTSERYIDRRLPIGPFREFLRSECEKVKVRNDVVDDDELPALVGHQCGLGRKQVKLYLEDETIEDVQFRVVDRVLSKHGGATVADLYPFEYKVIPIGYRRVLRCGGCGEPLQRAASRCGFCLEQEKGLAA